MTEKERKDEFATLCAMLHPPKHKRAVVVAEFLGISAQTVRVYMSKKSGKAPSMVLISLFSLKLKSPQVR